ncbi:uncharacterized protein LOC143831971 [Paroedura picta]|uniref:uncharacterized protein LOC143831971 n=1 Tax=Paroedura picta TaxID=143630 RepID=UPI004057B676
MFYLLNKSNLEILKAVKKIVNEIQDTRKELSDRINGLKKTADENTNQLTTYQSPEVRQQKWERTLEAEPQARSIKIKDVPEELGKTDLRKEITKSPEHYIQEEEIQIDKVYRAYSKATARKNQPRDFFGPDSKVARNTPYRNHQVTQLSWVDQETQIHQDPQADTSWKRTQFNFLRPPEECDEQWSIYLASCGKDSSSNS